MIYVVGSGPAGVSAAYALIQQGLRVTMLDIGVEIEPERQELVDRLYTQSPEQWQQSDIANLKGEVKAGLGGIPLKRLYGSDFPHRNSGQLGELDSTGVKNPVTSPARGGFSVIWGAQFMPNRPEDMREWCVSAHDLAPHYEAVLSFVPLAARSDQLTKVIPLPGKPLPVLNPSRQGAAFLNTLERNQEVLEANGFYSGLSRLAVQSKPSDSNPHSCVYCGMCMHGCPYKLIYNSSFTLRTLMESPLFTYIPHTVVDRVVEEEDTVIIHTRSYPNNEPKTFRAERVFLACGAVSTTRILMESLNLFDQDIKIQDSVRVLMPFLHRDVQMGVLSESLHTLGQVNVLLLDSAISDYSMHLQFYTYNDHFIAAFKGILGPLFPVAKPFLPLLLGRLSIAFGWLDSHDSPHMVARLEKRGTNSVFVLNHVPNPRANEVALSIARKMWKLRRYFQGVPLTPAIKVMDAGNGYHYGGSFPMQENPKSGETDRWGRPPTMRRVHAVDGSILPSITSTTFTYTIMANAHRIASEISLYDPSIQNLCQVQPATTGKYAL
ncbi:MAG: hypothetical protein OHK0029_01750 [Armatimonadaceae bacterium]